MLSGNVIYHVWLRLQTSCIGCQSMASLCNNRECRWDGMHAHTIVSQDKMHMSIIILVCCAFVF